MFSILRISESPECFSFGTQVLLKHGVLSVQNYIYVILLLTGQTERHSMIIKDDVRRLEGNDNINFYQCKQLKAKDIAKGCGEFSIPYHLKYTLYVCLKDFLDFSHKLLGLM